MARQVNERPLFPQVTPQDPRGLIQFAGTLVKQLVATFQDYGWRLNRVLPKDGSEKMDRPLPLVRYDEADLPDASEWEGAIVYVSDGGSGSRFRGSDGSQWVDLG